MTGMETYLPPAQSRRDGPPPSSRGFDKLDRVDPPRHRSRSRTNVDHRPDPALVAREPLLGIQRPPSSARTPVVTHQPGTSGRHADGYSSYGEEYDRRHHDRHSRHADEYRPHHHSRDDEPDERRHRHKEDRHKDDRHKDDSDHGKSLRNDLIGGALAAVGLGGVAATATKDRDHDRRDKDRRDRDRETDRSDESPTERERRHRERHNSKTEEPREHRKERRGGSSEDDEYSDVERRRRREARNRERDLARDRERRRNEDSESGSDIRNTERRRDLRERGSDDEIERRHRDREHAGRYGSVGGGTAEDSAYNPAALVPSQDEERPKKVTLVEPSTNKEPEAPPKGILKPPRERFPEEPNPVREGVAPLKEAGKKGIPPNARWTKIDRRLVNPAALEDANERFEERPDYVIVLRVLTKEEIQKFAEKTQEIRDIRYQAARAERHERHRLRKEQEARGEIGSRDERRRDRAERRDRRHEEDDSYSDESDTTEDSYEDAEEHKTPLGIEAPPPRSQTVDPTFGLGNMANPGNWRNEFDSEREREREREMAPNAAHRR